MNHVAVITDSTSYLPRGWATRDGIGVVPVQVIVAGRAFDETDGDQAQKVADALKDWQPVTTSRPTPARFLESYVEAVANGATHIVVATLSRDLSSTYESALLAAQECSVPVTVIDSRTIGMALGFAAIAGAQAAKAGASGPEVAAVITRRSAAASTFFMVDTLEYLRRGGRIGAARAVMGQALQVKPILTVTDGSVVALEQVRTASKAVARLEELAAAAIEAAVACEADVDVAVQHLVAEERAGALATRLRVRYPRVSVDECPVGGVVGAHAGPGLVCVVVSPRA
ncbi:MAG: DegV family protein [Candidatus Nanopelagicales bacterium]|nr:DegV family protein [Candidatus Nanopelagicales bacterium]